MSESKNSTIRKNKKNKSAVILLLAEILVKINLLYAGGLFPEQYVEPPDFHNTAGLWLVVQVGFGHLFLVENFSRSPFLTSLEFYFWRHLMNLEKFRLIAYLWQRIVQNVVLIKCLIF